MKHWLVVEPTHLKKMLVKLDHLPQKTRVIFSKYLSCYHPATHPNHGASHSLCSSMGSRLPTGCGTLLGKPRPGPCKGTSKVPSVQALRSEDLRSSRLKPNVTCQVIQGDLFGMVKWPFQMVKWPPTRGWKGHIESPGADRPKIPPGFFFWKKSPGNFQKKPRWTWGATATFSSGRFFSFQDVERSLTLTPKKRKKKKTSRNLAQPKQMLTRNEMIRQKWTRNPASSKEQLHIEPWGCVFFGTQKNHPFNTPKIQGQMPPHARPNKHHSNSTFWSQHHREISAHLRSLWKKNTNLVIQAVTLLGWWVNTWPFSMVNRDLQRSGMKRSRIESPGNWKIDVPFLDDQIECGRNAWLLCVCVCFLFIVGRKHLGSQIKMFLLITNICNKFVPSFRKNSLPKLL